MRHKNETVEIMPFKNVSEKHAYLEGEGDRSYESWRKVHEAFSPGNARKN